MFDYNQVKYYKNGTSNWNTFHENWTKLWIYPKNVGFSDIAHQNKSPKELLRIYNRYPAN